jgi:hypothetical protein
MRTPVCRHDLIARLDDIYNPVDKQGFECVESVFTKVEDLVIRLASKADNPYRPQAAKRRRKSSACRMEVSGSIDASPRTTNQASSGIEARRMRGKNQRRRWSHRHVIQVAISAGGTASEPKRTTQV